MSVGVDFFFQNSFYFESNFWSDFTPIRVVLIISKFKMLNGILPESTVNAGKSLTSRARQFFIPSESENAKSNPKKKFMMCIICKQDINCTSETNIVPHLKNKHKNEFKLHVDIESCTEEPSVTRLKLLQSCVELVTINGKKFSTLSCSGFLHSHENTLNKLNLAGYALKLKDPHLNEVKEHLKKTAKRMREKIKEEVRGKMLSLMIDGATRNGRSLLGFSVQYAEDCTVKVVTLGVKELIQEYTSEYLCAVIKKTLEQYGINLHLIITVTSDNASNMLATTRELENELNPAIPEDIENENGSDVASEISEIVDDQSQDDEATDDESVDDRIRNIINNDEMADEEALNAILDESSIYDSLLFSVVGDLRSQTGNQVLLIDQIRCAAHTVQLAINDSLKNLQESTLNVVNLCRKVAKFMRLQNTQHQIRRMEIETILPILDNETRWNSKYLMVRNSQI